MAYPTGHRTKVKKKIVSSARRLFNRLGFEKASSGEFVGDVAGSPRLLAEEEAVTGIKRALLQLFRFVGVDEPATLLGGCLNPGCNAQGREVAEWRRSLP
jgi:hypothetical protein